MCQDRNNPTISRPINIRMPTKCDTASFSLQRSSACNHPSSSVVGRRRQVGGVPEMDKHTPHLKIPSLPKAHTHTRSTGQNQTTCRHCRTEKSAQSAASMRCRAVPQAQKRDARIGGVDVAVADHAVEVPRAMALAQAAQLRQVVCGVNREPQTSRCRERSESLRETPKICMRALCVASPSQQQELP